MKKFYSLVIISTLIVIFSLINCITILAKEIDIKELNEDKSVIILNDNFDNLEIINKVENVILINSKGHIISIPKEYYNDFKYYKLLGYENNNTYYLYSNAKNLIDKICNTIEHKKIIYSTVVFIIMLVMVLIFYNIAIYYEKNYKHELVLLMYILLIITVFLHIPVQKYIDDLSFEKSISSKINTYVEPVELLNLEKDFETLSKITQTDKNKQDIKEAYDN